MKHPIKLLSLIFLLFAMVFTSCRNEEVIFEQAPAEEILAANSVVASLIRNTATNDGSSDNIIDNANCFNIQLPVTVIVNGEEITINTEEDLDTIEDIFDEFDDDIDELEILFPITIILDDFTAVIVINESELENYADDCNGENEADDDIECIDFQYPINASIFNSSNELLDTVTITNDNELFDFIDDLDEFDIVTIDFPITVILFDGSTQTINSLQDLQIVIQNAEDDCDEDDDFDFNDDDCDNCTTSDLSDVLVGCSDWMIDKLERNDNDLEDLYVGYVFNFFSDGTISVDTGSSIYPGTWSANGSGNNITVAIDVPMIPDINDSWILHEIETDPGESDVDLRLGDDRLRFESDCSGGGGVDDTALVQALTTGIWYITYFFDDTDQTSDFTDFVFDFATDGTATATYLTTTNGIWSTSAGDETPLELNLNFGATDPLDEIAEDWDVLEVTSDIIRLKDLSGGDGSTDFLTFERTQGGGGGNDLDTILEDGLWFVASYTEDSDDQTANYNGYQIDFMAGGNVTADNGSIINGTWAVQSSGNVLVLDFGTSVPFDEFNDDWDVISVSDTQVVIQDVSGGNGGTDTLTLEKL
ncbi:MAG: hypothetical protein KJO77_10900 [Bacteroidia bacterium]|nr:hypothetical protein [Bacteroidia bacterium]